MVAVKSVISSRHGTFQKPGAVLGIIPFTQIALSGQIKHTLAVGGLKYPFPQKQLEFLVDPILLAEFSGHLLQKDEPFESANVPALQARHSLCRFSG